jgi:O-antigen/teichoic acid export membrane protein
MGTFTKNTIVTVFTRFSHFALAATTSIAIARILGPENKGVFALAILLPTLLMRLVNIGIPQATVYYVAKRVFDKKVILGNTLLISLVLGVASLLIGLTILLFFQDSILPNIPKSYALIALIIAPIGLLYNNFKNIFLGLQKIYTFNFFTIAPDTLGLTLSLTALLILNLGVPGLIAASILSSLVSTSLLIAWVKRSLGTFNLSLNKKYLKAVSLYGFQTYIGRVVVFLNYRLDQFILNGFLNPTAVGFYTISVSISERLWILSSSASAVLFPRIASGEKKAREEHTPLVSRNILLITAAAAFFLYLISGWLIPFLYSAEFSPSVRSLQILLIGVVVLSPSRVLAGDISGRGHPLANSIISSIALAFNIVLNIIWIPQYGIEGAAWATSLSYSLSLIGRLYLYRKISGISIWRVLVPQPSDFFLYKKIVVSVFRKVIS